WLPGNRVPCTVCVLARADPGLPLAVVAVAPGLKDEGKAELLDRRAQFRKLRDGAPWGDPPSALLDELLFDRSVLGDRERAGTRPKLVAKTLKRSNRQVFKFVGDDIDGTGELLDRRGIAVIRTRELCRDIGGGRMLVRVKDMASVAELGRSHA